MTVCPPPSGGPSRALRAAAGALLATGLVLPVPGGIAAALEPGTRLASGAVRQWTDADGLPLNTVKDVVQTPEGHIWVATVEGLARFDGVRFEVFDGANTPAIRNDFIWDLLVARDGSLWVATFGGGLVHLRDGEWTVYDEEDGLWDDDVRALDEDGAGTLWIATSHGLNALDPGGTPRAIEAPGNVPDDLQAIQVAADGSVWVGSATRGLARYREGRFTRYTTRQGLPHDVVWTLYRDRGGTLWVGTKGGLARYEAGRFVAHTTRDGRQVEDVFAIYGDRQGTLWVGIKSGSLHRLEGDRLVPDPSARELFGSPIRALTEDHEGSLWIGTDTEGLFRLHDALITPITSERGLAADRVWSVHEDRRRRIWVGTGGGLSWLHPGETLARSMRGEPSGVPIRFVLEDRTGRLWVAAGREVKVRDEGGWTTYSAADGLSGGDVLYLLEDRAGRLWIGTTLGLNLLEDGVLSRYTSADGLAGSWIDALHESRDGTLWVGTTRGASTVRVDEGRVTFTPVEGLSSDHVLSFYEESDGTLWIGTHGGGLNRLRHGRVRTVDAEHGLCDGVVFAILADDFGNLWTSSNKGLCRVSRKRLAAFLDGEIPRVDATAYGVADGMVSSECNDGAAWRGRDGRLWFGTTGGAVVVDPGRLNRVPPPVTVDAVDLGKGWTPALPGLRIPPGASRDIRIRFAAASFQVPEKVRFRYRLEGRDASWTQAEDRREVAYVGLPAGDYAFHVIAANNDGVWNERGATLAFVVEPRFVETTAFRVLIAVAILALALGAYVLRSWQLKHRLAWLEATVEERTAELKAQRDETEEALATVRRQRQEIEALSEARSRFFANVSHELRTPLTLLVGPLQDQLRGVQASAERTETMMRNARRLERLVEQLLDLERLDAGQLPSRPVAVDLAGVARDSVRAFADLAEREGIELEAELGSSPVPVHVDVDHIGRVLGNLLSNALKFTPRGGRVRVTLRRLDARRVGDGGPTLPPAGTVAPPCATREGEDDPAAGHAELTIEDTGPGVPREWRERIFDRFAQMGNRDTQAREGAGLGLALCRELVRLHGGQLHVEAAAEAGARFVLRIPLIVAAALASAAIPATAAAARAEAEASEALHDPTPAASTDGTPPLGSPPANGTVVLTPETGSYRVLIAEDNPDLRRYIEEILADTYETQAVEDGEAALAAVWREPPDVIVSDIVMPRRDGFALARALRAEPDFAGIPLIFLTARAGDADRIAGLAIGADQYLKKPFRSEVLKAHVAAALRTCLRLRDQLARQAAEAADPSLATGSPATSPSGPGASARPAGRTAATSNDADTGRGTLPDRVRRWIEAHAHDDSLNVDDLAAALHMSPATLRRKLRAATGMSPARFIRTARLARARTLLHQAAGNVSEIAYAVGFNSLAVFSRAYNSTYGEPPSRALRDA